MNTIKKKGNDIIVGDVIKYQRGDYINGIVISKTNKEIVFYDLNDNRFGPITTSYNKDQEYNILIDRKEIIQKYKDVEYDLLEHSANLMRWRNELIGIKNDYLF